MDPKYKIGQIVKVYDYYADMIVKDYFYGLIVEVKSYHRESTTHTGFHHIYSILPDGKHKVIQTAEEFAIDPLET